MAWKDAEQKVKKLSRPFFEAEKVEKLGEIVKALDGMEKVDTLLHFLGRV
jgi:hypothetical protein